MDAFFRWTLSLLDRPAELINIVRVHVQDLELNGVGRVGNSVVLALQLCMSI